MPAVKIQISRYPLLLYFISGHFSNNQKFSVQVTEDPQASRSSSTVSACDTEVSEIMSSQPSAEVANWNTTSITPSPIMSDGDEEFLNFLNRGITDELKISSPNVFDKYAEITN